MEQRIATSDVHAALERAADQLRSAAGPDGIVSRRDVRARLQQLEGTERAIVEVLYRFIDGRDAARSARVTKSDIDATVAHVRTELIDRLDLDQNGLSADEIARMSELGKLAVALAQTLKDATAPGGKALAAQLASLADGLWLNDFATEGGEGFTAFHAAAGLSELTQDTLRAALGLTADRPEHEIARFEAADRCLERIINQSTDEDMPGLRDKAVELVRVMKTHLRALTAAVIGRDDTELVDVAHPAYVVGIDANGDLVGLKSSVIWT
jgi:hypothetical protein